VAREPAFPKRLNKFLIGKMLVIDDKRPTIPAFVLPAVKNSYANAGSASFGVGRLLTRS
jgi:hypothetical protein